VRVSSEHGTEHWGFRENKISLRFSEQYFSFNNNNNNNNNKIGRKGGGGAELHFTQYGDCASGWTTEESFFDSR